LPGQIVAGAGGIVTAGSWLWRAFASNPDAVQAEKLITEIEDAEIDEQKAKHNLTKLGDDLGEIASRLNYTNGDELFKAYMDYIKAQEVIEPLAQAERILAQAHEDELEAAQNLSPFFERAGVEMPKNFILEEAEQLLKRYQTASQTDDEHRELSKKRQELEVDIIGLEKERSEVLQFIQSTLSLAGIEGADGLDDAVEIFRNGRDSHQRYISLVSDIIGMIVFWISGVMF